MASRGSQTPNLANKNRLKRISRIKAQIAQLEKQGGTGKGSFRTRTKISQLKKTLRDIGGGYQKTKTYKTEKKEVKTSRGLKIRNVSKVKPKPNKDKKMSNIPVGEGYVNNPNYGKKPKKTESNTDTESSSNTSSNTETKNNKTEFGSVDLKASEGRNKTETKKYGRVSKGYIKTGGKFASLKSVKGKRAAMKADRMKILQDRIKKKKKEKK